MNLKNFLNIESQNIADYLNNLNEDVLNKIYSIITEYMKKNIIFTGIGKSFLVGEKVTSTLNSIGIKARSVDPVHILHGEMNTLNSNEVIFVFSKSGETKELIEFCQECKKRKIKTILVTTRENSLLSKFCKEEIIFPKIKELDKWNKVPTSSPIIYQIIFESVGIFILNNNENFNFDNFQLSHPGGELGHVKN